MKVVLILDEIYCSSRALPLLSQTLNFDNFDKLIIPLQESIRCKKSTSVPNYHFG